MRKIETDDGVELAAFEAGEGDAIVFVHEFAGEAASWEPQIRRFSRTHRCVAYNARGYPPSAVPEDPAAYSQDRAVADLKCIVDAFGIERAHVVGLSMGGFAALHLALRHPGRCRSLTVASAGYGADPAKRDQFRAETDRMAAAMEQDFAAAADAYAHSTARIQYRDKDPRGFADFRDRLLAHSPGGSARTLRGVQRDRPSLWDFVDAMRRCEIPALIVAGDEDDPCLEPALLMKRNIPGAGLVVMPMTGHTLNLEEPDAFNRALADFLHRVERGRWPRRTLGTGTGDAPTFGTDTRKTSG